MSNEKLHAMGQRRASTDDEVIIEYLKAALSATDPAFVMRVVGNVARAKGIHAVLIQ